MKFIRKEPVLFVSAVFALVSVFFNPYFEKYPGYVDFKTLACLFCLMVSVKGLERMGVLWLLSEKIQCKINNFRLLAVFLVLLCFFSSMVMTNDVALIAIVPLSILLLKDLQNSRLTAVIIVLQTIAANIGSSLTPIGNPQNVFLYFKYDMKLLPFLSVMFPYVMVGMVGLLAACLLLPDMKNRAGAAYESRKMEKGRFRVYLGLFLVSILSVFGILPVYAAFFIVVLTVLLYDRKTLYSVDYALLLTFVFLFIFVGNISSLPFIYEFIEGMIRKNVLLAALSASQFISNVPAALLLSGFTDQSESLLLGVNIGGLGTLIAFMASIISFKLYVAEYKGKALRYVVIFTGFNILFLGLLLLVAVAGKAVI